MEVKRGNVSEGAQGNRCSGRLRRARGLLQSKTCERKREKAGTGVPSDGDADVTKSPPALAEALKKKCPLERSTMRKND